MGCDIHLHVEIKLKGEWHHYQDLRPGRHYSVFGKMAGVRNQDEEPIVAPKGLPADCTLVTRFDSDHWGRDGHTHSWFNREEIKKLSVWMTAQAKDWREDLEGWAGGYLFGNDYAGELEDLPEGVEDVRFVFWFDN